MGVVQASLVDEDVEALVKSVLAFDRKPFEEWERWRVPVLEAAAAVAREHAPPPPPAVAWKGHGLDCACEECTSPPPRYARAWGAAG